MARASSTKVTIDILGEREVMAMLERLPKLVVSAGGSLDRAVQKASNVAAKRARQLAPDSRRTGTRPKQSKKSRAIWKHQLRSVIRVKLARYPHTRIGIVGPKSPEGNHAHFMQEKPRRHVLWGRSTRIAQLRIARNWITQAFDETRGEQMDAMKSSLQADIDQQMRSA